MCMSERARSEIKKEEEQQQSRREKNTEKYARRSEDKTSSAGLKTKIWIK